MSKTYLAVFKCEALGERKSWYVSSRKAGRFHLRQHIDGSSHKMLAKYKANPWTYQLRTMFEDGDSVVVDSIKSG